MQKLWKNWLKVFIQKNFKNFILILCAIIILVVLMFLSIGLGALEIDYIKVKDIILYNLGCSQNLYWTKTENLIIWDMRLPRIILACLAGAGLAVSGVAMQAVVKNPLADPYILGISAGASAGATAIIALNLIDITQEYSVSIGAFSGAMLSMLILFFLNKSNKDSVRL